MTTIRSILLAILAICAFSSVNAGSADASKRISNGNLIFEAGALNGTPRSADSPLAREEFKLLNFSGDTRKIKTPADFPQTLRPRQRIALFLRKVGVPAILRVRASVTGNTDAKSPAPEIEILVNGRIVWRHALNESPSFVEAFAFPDTLDEAENVIQIRNIGETPLAFDWLAVDQGPFPNRPLRLIVRKLQEIPYSARRLFRCGAIEMPASLVDSLIISEDFKPLWKESAASPWKTPRKERMAFLEKAKKTLAAVTTTDSASAKAWRRFSKSFFNTIASGKEPALTLTGSPLAKKLTALRELLGGSVGTWMFPNIGSGKSFGEFPPLCDVFTIDGGFGATPLVSSSGYAIPSPLKLMIAGRKVDDSSELILARGVLGNFDFLNRMRLGGGFLVKKARLLAADLNKWCWSGGSGFLLRHVHSGGLFFDPLTGEPTVILHSLTRVAAVLHDGSKRLPCNVTPSISGEVLKDVAWTCVSDSPNNADILLTTRCDKGRQVVISMVLPFSGRAICETSRGFAPLGKGKNGFTEIKRETSELEVTEIGENGKGLAQIKLNLAECLTLSISKKGTSHRKNPLDLRKGFPKRRVKYLTTLLKVSFKPPAPTLVRSPIRWPNGLFGFQGQTKRQAAFGMNAPPPKRKRFKPAKGKWGHPYYAGLRNFPATRGEIDGVPNVVPWNDKSTLVRIAYPDGKPGRSEGVRLFFGGRNASRPDYLSFWVRPTSEIKTDKLRLRFFFDNRGKNLFLETFVKPKIWQRVVLPLKSGIEAPLWKDICIVGDPKLPEFRKGAMVSYEFNGFSILSKPDELFAHREIVLKGTAAAPREMAFLFFGVPGTRGQYRRRFTHAVEIDSLKLLTPMDAKHKPKLTYKQAAQTLQIDVQFPTIPVAEWEKPIIIPPILKSLLTKREISLIEKEGLSVVAMKFSLKN